MAKQSGIHQLRGKVGEHSYYRQTGISTGLVRSINPAMSGRVKTDEAYANTRLNNREFGQAGRVASMLAKYIQPKFRPMVLPFSQSKMAKILLEYIKLDTTAPWGGRNLVVSSSGDAQVEALNAVVKNRFEDWGIEVTDDEERSAIEFVTTAVTVAKAASIGATGLLIRTIVSVSWIGTYNATDQKYAPSYARGNRYDEEIIVNQTTDFEVYYAVPSSPPQGWPAFPAERMALAIVLPFREIDNNMHFLQEHCTFFAWVMTNGRII